MPRIEIQDAIATVLASVEALDGYEMAVQTAQILQCDANEYAEIVVACSDGVFAYHVFADGDRLNHVIAYWVPATAQQVAV